jgi:transcription initiation factor IIE alpha subunit
MTRKKIRGSEIVNDIRSGVDDAGLMEKYGLSAKGILKLMGKLISQGLISPSELAERKSLAKTIYFPIFKCPKCTEIYYTRAGTCPTCGAVMTQLNKAPEYT